MSRKLVSTAAPIGQTVYTYDWQAKARMEKERLDVEDMISRGIKDPEQRAELLGKVAS